MYKFQQRLDSAQRKMEFHFGKKSIKPEVAAFEPIPEEKEPKIIPHNSDQLLKTGDLSDIKNSAKTLF